MFCFVFLSYLVLSFLVLSYSVLTTSSSQTVKKRPRLPNHLWFVSKGHPILKTYCVDPNYHQKGLTLQELKSQVIEGATKILVDCALTQGVSLGSGETIKIKSVLDCQTSNVLYELHCLRDSLPYIGETSKTVEKRTVGHLNTILQDCHASTCTPVGQHFCSAGSSNTNS